MDIQFRAFYILRNIVRTNQELAARVVASELMDIVFAIQEIKDDQITNDKVCRGFRSSVIELKKF